MDDQKPSKWPKYAVFSLIFVVVLLLILILILYLIKSPLIYRSSAYSETTSTEELGIPTSLSLDNSYVFASPLRAKSGGEKIRVTVFVLDSRGLGMSQKKVSISSGGPLTVTAVQTSTDGQGRATFDVSSGSGAGVYVIGATVDGAKLTQQATISFD